MSVCLSQFFSIDLDQCLPDGDKTRQEIAGGNLNRICRTVTYCSGFLLSILQNKKAIEMYWSLSRQLPCIEVVGNLNTSIEKTSVFIFATEKLNLFLAKLPFKDSKVSMNTEYSTEKTIPSNEGFNKETKILYRFSTLSISPVKCNDEENNRFTLYEVTSNVCRTKLNHTPSPKMLWNRHSFNLGVLGESVCVKHCVNGWKFAKPCSLLTI